MVDPRFAMAVLSAVVILTLVGCGGVTEEEAHEGAAINPTPTKENGEPSYEFEPEDIERAEGASRAVQEYCEGAVSEAQEVGCLSHVEPSEVP